MKYLVDIGSRRMKVEIVEHGDSLAVKVDNRPIDLDILSDQQHKHLLMLFNARPYDTEILRGNGRTSVFLRGRQFDCLVEDERLASIREIAGVRGTHVGTEIYAPMPGLVVKILKKVGDRVKKHERVLIVEAMKMENELKSPAEGIIKEIHVQEGRPVDKGALLVSIE